MSGEDGFDAWLALLQGAYKYVKTGKLRQLNGDRPPEWRAGGLHDYSYQWGWIDALTPPWMDEAMAGAHDQLAISPSQLREAAEADALAEFVERITA